jgi:hypothetical protein
MRWGDWAGSTSRALAQTHVRPPQRRFDTRSCATVARVVDFKRRKEDQGEPERPITSRSVAISIYPEGMWQELANSDALEHAVIVVLFVHDTISAETRGR